MSGSAGRVVIGVLAAAGLALAVVLGPLLGSSGLLEVVSPSPGQVVGVGGVEVMVRFADLERVAPETFRVLLNGADATPEFTTGENGAYGQLHGLLDGENVLRFEVFARRWWLPGLWLEEAQEVRILVRLPHAAQRA